MLASDPRAALDCAGSLIGETPDARAYRLAAAALRALGRDEEAAQAELDGIRCGFPDPLQRAKAAQQSRRGDEGKAIAEEYLRTHPDDLLAMTIAAEAELGLGRGNDAEPMLRRVVDRAPGFAPASMLLANMLSERLRLREAAQVLEALVARAPQETNAKRFLADLRARMNEPSAAAALYEQVVAATPHNPADQYKLAQNLRAAGHREQSIAALRRGIDRSPLDAHLWWMLAFYFPEEVTEQDERQVRAAIASPGLQTGALKLLQVAISVLENRRGNYAAAYDSIAAAKALPSGNPPHDPDSLARHIDELIAAYTSDVFERFRPSASKSDAPIFIVGLPRSGSTLVERILGQHSSIEPTGEIPVMARLVAEQPESIARYRNLLPGALTGDKVAEMGSWYLNRSSEYRHTAKPRFTDKYNSNWIRAPLIRLIFPDARIVDVRRDPLDCCWSVFKTMFADEYARDQRHLARYYADYVRLIDATAAASPGGILTIRYEELVTDLERQTRRILDFLALEFEQACVDFHRSTAPVATPSSEQVKRPISNQGIGSAEPYRQWLQPLIDELESALAKSA